MTYRGRVALLTYSTKPRGGVVHTLALGEALFAAGVDVHVYALGDAFYRETSVPHTLFAAPDNTESLEDKVFASVDALADGLGRVVAGYDLLHSQDCISGRAATRVRDARDPGAAVQVFRTV